MHLLLGTTPSNLVLLLTVRLFRNHSGFEMNVSCRFQVYASNRGLMSLCRGRVFNPESLQCV